MQLKSRRDKQTQLISLGDFDPLNIIGYSGLEELPDYLIIDGTYIRTLYISGYPFVASSGWLDGLINFSRNMDISFHLASVDATTALPKLNRKITELESTKRALIKAGRIIGSDLTDPLDSAIEIKNKIQRGQEKLFLTSIYVSLRADTLEELDKITKLVESALAARLFYSKSARYQQLDGLQSVLPRAEDPLAQRRNMDSSSAALCFPFVSSEFVQESGILYGVNKSNSSLVMLDRFNLNNANSITFAQSGSGKSYATKLEILRQLIQGTSVIVVDPEREYVRLAESVGGTIIQLAVDSEQHINLFDLGSTANSNSTLSGHIQDITEVLSLMADGFSAREKAVVDKAIIATYKKHQQPLLEDFYRNLIDLNELRLAERFEKYTSGSLAQPFNHPTDIDLTNRLVVFDIKDMNESIRPIMMVIIANYVQNKVKNNPAKRLLVIDEGWLLLEHEQSARFIAGLVRRARKYWLGVSIISQQANDFLLSDYGRAIASQSALRILMRQDTTTIKNVVKEFQLSEYEENLLLTCDKGEALIIADLNHVALSVIAAETEHPLITTDPLELYEAGP